MNPIVLDLPVPSRVLSPNSRPHFRVLAKAKKEYRHYAKMASLSMVNSPPPRWTRASVAVRWFTKTKRRPDADNALASLKAAFDGLTDAGVLADDRDVSYQPIVFAVDKARPRVELTITPL